MTDHERFWFDHLEPIDTTGSKATPDADSHELAG